VSEFKVQWEEGLDVGYQTERLKAWAQTKASPKLSPREVALLVLSTGWTGEDAVTAVAVVGAESGFRIRAKNVAKNGTFDAGLFQINSIHGYNEGTLYVPGLNAQAAYKLYQRRGFQPWVAYKNGRYREFMQIARQAVQDATSLPADPKVTP
jgi:hypothetical protein